MIPPNAVPSGRRDSVSARPCRELSSGILNSSDYGRTAARMRRGRRVPPEFR